MILNTSKLFKSEVFVTSPTLFTAANLISKVAVALMLSSDMAFPGYFISRKFLAVDLVLATASSAALLGPDEGKLA